MTTHNPNMNNALGFRLLRTIPLHVEVKSISLSPDARHIALLCLFCLDAVPHIHLPILLLQSPTRPLLYGLPILVAVYSLSSPKTS